MHGIEQRLDRIAELLGSSECVCARSADAPVAIVVIEDGWDEARIKIAEDEKLINCPVHGRQHTPILRLKGHDIDG